MPSEVEVYLSIGAVLWLVIEACFDECSMYLLRCRGDGDEKYARAGIVIGTVVFIAFWPFGVGYALISIMSAPVER